MNYYDVLGVKQTATDAEIKEAYRNLIKAFHPDYYQGNKDFADRKSKEINEAYATLKDHDLRRKYDDLLAQGNSSDRDRQQAEAEADWARQSARAAEERAEEEHRRFEEEQKRRMEAEEDSRKSRAEAAEMRSQMTNNSASLHSYDNRLHKSAKIKIILFCIISVAVVAFIIVLHIHDQNVEEAHINNNEIQSPGSASSYIEKNYQDVMNEFLNAGFDNIETVPLNDLITGWITKNESVDSISIAGDTSFSYGEYFKKDALIRITYHSFSGKSTESSRDAVTKSKTPEAAKTYKKMRYDEVKKSLENAGFTNINAIANEDLKTGWIHKDGDVESISIDGNDNFKAGDLFLKNASVKIVYHSFKNKTSSNTDNNNIFDDVRDFLTDKLKKQ